MSEKNTQTILESIKKKLNKFDQKPENKIADLAHEFDYVAPAKIEEVAIAPMSSLPQENLMVMQEDQHEEDHLEEEHDIDLDDESSLKPVVEEVVSNAQNTESFTEFSAEDLEDFEDEIDVDDFEDDDDDLGFDHLPRETEPVLETTTEEVIVPHDDFDLQKLDFELNNHKAEQPVQSSSATVSVDPVNDELDELEREIARQKEQAAQQVEEVADPIDLDDELFGTAEIEEEKQESESFVPSVSEESHTFVEQNNEEMPDLKQFESHLEPISEMPKMPESNHFETDFEEIIAPKTPAEMLSAQLPVMSVPTQTPMPVPPAIEMPIKKVESGNKTLVSEETLRQATDSVKKLLDAKNIVSGIASFTQSPMLSELAMQMLEPKLEKWLNSNLSEMVEKIVREEIKKIIPKGE